MTSLLGRALGFTGPVAFQRSETDQRIRELRAVSWVHFNGNVHTVDGADISVHSPQQYIANALGVNCLAIEEFNSRFLLAGSADASISLWDLDRDSPPFEQRIYKPVGTIPKSPEGHQFGITTVSFYPIDPGAFISSSYDKSIHVWDTESLRSAISFSVPGQVYAHDISPIANHLLVAVAVQDSFIRLLDLDSGASTHTLPGHEGAVLSVAWSPSREHVLASAGSDGTVRLWDIRSAGNSLGSLNYEDTSGILEPTIRTDDYVISRNHKDAKAHIGPCNGIMFSSDGQNIVSCGHDERIRVWDSCTGANKLVHFGPMIRNNVLASIRPALIPPEATAVGQELMLYPNGAELLLLDIHGGTLLRRLRSLPGVYSGAQKAKGLKRRVTDVCWRKGHCEAYSAHSNGYINAWIPYATEEDVTNRQPQEDGDTKAELSEEAVDGRERKRRREELNQVFREFTKKEIVFTPRGD